jgi:Fe-S-cluster containining protein
MNWDCSRCTGVCCLTPPALYEEEIAKAYSLKPDITIIAVEIKDNKYAVSIAKDSETDTCPFLVEGKCSIYNDRFKACRDYTCKALDNTVELMSKVSWSNRLNKMVTSSTPVNAIPLVDYFSMDGRVEITTREDAILRVNSHSSAKVTKMMIGCNYDTEVKRI